MGGSKYLATFLDDYSKLLVVRPIAAKSEVPAVTKEIIALLEKQSGSKVLRVRTDNGSEYVNADLNVYLRERGVHTPDNSAFTRGAEWSR